MNSTPANSKTRQIDFSAARIRLSDFAHHERLEFMGRVRRSIPRFSQLDQT
jgi:hypothetical protein